MSVNAREVTKELSLLPRVLYLTHHLPWPARSGGRVREAELLRRLGGIYGIDVVAISKVPELDRQYLHHAERHGVNARVFPARVARRASGGPLRQRHHSPEASRHIAHALSEHNYDIIHVEGHYLLHLLPPRERRRAILVEHNVESVLFAQRARVTQCVRERWRLEFDARLTRRAERTSWLAARMVVAVTEDDAALIRNTVPGSSVSVVRNGANHLSISSSAACSSKAGNRSSLLLVGNFSYEPNLDAVRILLSKIFPAVAAECPDARLAIVGSNPPTWLIQEASRLPNVVVTGWVPDLSVWLDSADLMICPLRVGGGIKVKILEALTRGLPVVTTPIGSQGLADLPGGSLIESSDSAALIAACVRLLRSPFERRAQGQRALAAARTLPTWNQAAEALSTCWSAGVGRPQCARVDL